MTDSPRTAADRCYRHPDRQSFVLCQRCGRTICPECQTPAAVGVICPEDMKEQRRTAPRSRVSFVTRMTRSSAPVATYGIMAVCAVVWILQVLPIVGGYVTTSLWFAPVYGSVASGDYEPWRMLTSAFTHSPDSIFHILLNMLSVFVFGRVLEPMLGRVRFLALFLISAMGGSLAVEVIGAAMGDSLTAVVGASGAIFGLMGGYFVLARKLGGNVGPLLGIIVLNLLLGFVVQGVSWQAHVGGLVTGAVVALVLLRTRDPRQRGAQVGSLAALAAAIVVAAAVFPVAI
ncbi:rhomboid family intramembrane serine protease [Clavibacter capsici]|uniref:Rhomboid family intramembrane serine protease n=1 Tax=Clavibacter capsici TaxID=1874630 RepID=A0AAE6XNI2_9MICO|nr:rhomboid family intramembrane serine protease [Clavibacter capsici]ALD11573.1 rhomboid family protein [Clavibacter capsici]QIS43610.1 rhomboid family intramembrane serine protease [Clavibacter capsici]